MFFFLGVNIDGQHAISEQKTAIESTDTTAMENEDIAIGTSDNESVITEETIHHAYMRQAMDLAEEAHEAAEVPVGCVFVYTPLGKVVGSGRNRTNETLNGTRHAEFEGIDEIIKSDFFQEEVKRKGGVDKFWAEVTLYVTIEPCVMCASALRQLGIKEVYFGAGNDRFGGNGSVFNINQDTNLPCAPYPSHGGYYRKEAIMILRKFYVGENSKAPEPKKKKNRVLKEL